jgi:hypothetical protein
VVKDSLLVALSKLDDAPEAFTHDEYNILKDVSNILEHFNDGTEKLFGDKYTGCLS